MTTREELRKQRDGEAITTAGDWIASAIKECFISQNESDQNFEPANVVDGLFVIGRGLHRIADALECLGTRNATTEFGAIESMTMKIGESLSEIAEALRERAAR